MLPTIRSRCEIIKAMYDIHELNIDSLFDEQNKNLLSIATKYLEKIEVEKSNSIMYNKEVVISQITEREDVKKLFQIILIIYEEFFKNSLNLNNKHQLFENVKFLSNISNQGLLERIKLVTTFLDDIISNVNLELLLDKFVIELSDING